MNEERFAVGAINEPIEEQDQEPSIPALEEFDEEELDDIFERLEHGA